MKKAISFVLVLMLTLTLCLSAVADGFAGWWKAEETGALLYLGEDGMMQLRVADEDGEYENFEFFCSIIEEDGATKLLPFSTAAEYRYVQRFAERDGWMDLISERRVTTSWFNSTPEDVVNPGLVTREDMPLVGVWTMMSDGLTAPCFQFYDDGYFDYSDLMGLSQTEPLFGMCQLENGLLTLYPYDSGSTLRLDPGQDGNLKVSNEEQGTELVYAPCDVSALIPTADTIIGTWETPITSITFHEDGTLDMASISGGGTWSLNGLRLIISMDDPAWSFASYVNFVDGDPSRLCILQGDGLLTTVYTKK